MRDASSILDFSSDDALLASPDSILAYVLKDDPGIYIREGFVRTVAARMNAEIDDGALIFNEGGQRVRRGVDLLPPPSPADPWTTRIVIAEWHFRKGLICRRHSAGDWLKVVDDEGHTLYWYRIEEDSNWCVTAQNAECAVALTTIDGEFWYDGPGQGQPRTETHRLPKCYR
jgi:hypothetical protein